MDLVPADAHNALLGLGDQFHRVLMIAWLLPITALTLGLLCVCTAILRGKTDYPRWTAVFLNPVTAMAVGIALPQLMSPPLGIWLHGAGINIGWLFAYGVSTALLWESKTAA